MQCFTVFMGHLDKNFWRQVWQFYRQKIRPNRWLLLVEVFTKNWEFIFPNRAIETKSRTSQQREREIWMFIDKIFGVRSASLNQKKRSGRCSGVFRKGMKDHIVFVPIENYSNVLVWFCTPVNAIRSLLVRSLEMVRGPIFKLERDL